MSKLTVDEIRGLGETTYKNLPRGLASAWANLNGTGTIALRDSENVSSVVDNGTGEYTNNLTNSMSGANYNMTGTASENPAVAGSAMVFVARDKDHTRTPSSYRYATRYGNSDVVIDVSVVSSTAMGDLA